MRASRRRGAASVVCGCPWPGAAALCVKLKRHEHCEPCSDPPRVVGFGIWTCRRAYSAVTGSRVRRAQAQRIQLGNCDPACHWYNSQLSSLFSQLSGRGPYRRGANGSLCHLGVLCFSLPNSLTSACRQARDDVFVPS